MNQEEQITTYLRAARDCFQLIVYEGVTQTTYDFIKDKLSRTKN